MELGFTTMNTPEDPGPAELAGSLEQRGFGSLWIGEHSHIPSSRDTPYPVGGEMPEAYKRMMDPFVSLTAAACSTERLTVATGVILPLERDLFTLAKAVSTIDHVSGGRFVFGVGVGWNEEELRDHRPDIAWSQRYLALAEAVTALRSLWIDETSSFHGRWFDFDGAWSFPKPLQHPHPPVICGTGGPVGTRHAVAWGDGWAPMDVALGNVERRVTRFREKVREADRDDVPITLFCFGDPTADTLRAYRDLGIVRVVLGSGRDGWHDPETTYPFLDRYTPLVDDLA